MDTPTVTDRRTRPLVHIVLLASLLIGGLIYMLGQARPTDAAADLTVEIIAAYNLVVDSNVTSPSTYAPSVATVAGRFCNVGDTPLTNVQGYIGNYDSVTPANSTPGVYPSRDSSQGTFITQHPHLANTGLYAYAHVGGQLGTGDASRFVGTIPPGECRLQYWHFTYPRRGNPNNTGNPVWGQTNVPQDDLWLEFDVWATAVGETGPGANNSATKRMTMRNEISAMANKIRPNPDGRWFNTNSSVVAPGDVITSNGILYELGVVNQGFDNNGDFVPDYNAWVQPIGDPSYDPSCFRLIRTSGVLTVSRSAGQPDLIVPFHDNNPALSAPYGGPLYFTGLPDDNNGVRGEVFYTFMALNGPCATGLSPYQEVASGYDNEKFNGDYGTGIPPVASSVPLVTLNKTSTPTNIPIGSTTTYNIPFANTGTAGFGLGLSTGGSTPLVIEDTVPQGMQYEGGTAAATLTFMPNTGVTIRYSTNSGLTWSLTDPGDVVSNGPANLVMIQWWLNDTLPAGSTGNFATFQATVPVGYNGTPFIENCAQASLGVATPFAEACTINIVPGNNSIGDFVWRDEDADGIQDGGAETGIANVSVTLYYDANGNGLLDNTDPQVATTSTNGTGNYTFPNLPDGRYIVVVDYLDNDLPTGYTNTTTRRYAVALDPTSSDPNPVNFLTADFGFGPSLRVVKTLTSYNPAYVGEIVTFDIDLTNTLPGDGTAQGFCTYSIWATIPHQDNTLSPPGGNSPNAQWINVNNALSRPDGAYATTVMNDNTDLLGLSGFNTASQVGNITSVRFVGYFRELNNFKDTDNLFVRVWDTPGGTGPGAQLGSNYTYNGLTYFTGPAGTNYVISQDITSLRLSWNWGHFANNVTEMQLEGNRGGGAGSSGDIGLDAIAYVVTTDQLCGGADSTISYLPLVDTYNPAQLQFISANPMPNSTTPAGTLTWNNLGPLYAGGTRRISLQFRALTAVAAPGTLNTATVTNPQFANGRLANNGTDDAQVPILVSGSIAGRVWADTTNSGWIAPTGYDAGDTFLPNVRVQLYACVSTYSGLYITAPTSANQPCTSGNNLGAWQLVATTRTAANGSYLFSGLRDGYYNVIVDDTTLAANFTVNRAEAQPIGNGNGDSCPPSGTCDDQWNLPTADMNTFNNIVNGVAGENITNVSFGYRNTTTNAAVVGYVWHDVDADGVWDAGEQPISGVTVYLCPGAVNPCNAGSATLTTTTDANGFYSFERPPGSYRVGVLMPNGMTQSGDPDEGGPCSTCDNQNNAFALAGQQVRGPFNFGYTGGLSIGDTVYTDWDGDGAQDAGEEGINGVIIYLYRDSNSNGVLDTGEPLLATGTTDANGVYLFTNLPGNGNRYLVIVNGATIPAGYRQTGDPGEPGTCVVCDGRHPVTLTTANILTVDFGYRPRGFGSIGDTVWRDTNANGVQDPGEPPISGVVVNLYQDQDGDGILDPEDAFVGTTTTNGSGIYGFTNLAAGNYIVQVAASNFGTGQPLAGQTLTNSGAAYNAAQNSHQVTLGAGENYTDADFGYTSSAIGDFVWRDSNADGNQDPGETGIPGVTVRLFECTGSPTCTVSGPAVATTTTNASGYYEFTGLLPRTGSNGYVVEVDTATLPAGYSQTGDPDLTTVCSGATCDSSSTLTLALGQIDRSRDFGYRPLGVIGDTVWVDADNDGNRDANEAGIVGVTIYLCTSSPCNSGSAIANTVTDINGTYSFAGLPDNPAYFVGVEPTQIPAGFTQTYDPDGTINGEAANIVMSGGVVTSIGGTPCTNCDLNVDFGYRFTGAFNISGTVFFDPNNNATQDPTETYGYPSVTMYLWYCGADNNCATTGDNRYIGSIMTNSTGDYSFTNLPPGTYTVSVNRNAPNLVGLEPTITSGPITFRSVTIGPDANDVDFGFLSTIDLGDLPDSYRTSMLADGPRHTVTNTLYLGAIVSPDVDPNGQESATAGRLGDGDDGNGIDDEDGVVQRSGGGGAYHWGLGEGHVDITVFGTGCLLGWVDWDQDGAFDAAATTGGVSELILLASSPMTGSFLFTSPTLAQYGGSYPPELFARFRLFPPNDPRFGNMTVDANGCPTSANGETALNNLVGGVASAGEVEDYQFLFYTPTAVTLTQVEATFGNSPFIFGLPLLLLVMVTVAVGWAQYRRKLVKRD